MVSLTLGRLYPGKYRYSCYSRLSGPHRHRVKKKLYFSDTRDRTRAVQLIAKRLAACATWLSPGTLLNLGRGSDVLRTLSERTLIEKKTPKKPYLNQEVYQIVTHTLVFVRRTLK